MTYLRPPNDNACLTVNEIVRRATGAFGFTHCDQKRGLRYVTERLLNSQLGISHDEKDRVLALVADSIEMIAGDDRQSDDEFIKCYVIPGESVVVEYVYGGHAERIEPLLVRLADALGYEICRT